MIENALSSSSWCYSGANCIAIILQIKYNVVLCLFFCKMLNKDTKIHWHKGQNVFYLQHTISQKLPGVGDKRLTLKLSGTAEVKKTVYYFLVPSL